MSSAYERALAYANEDASAAGAPIANTPSFTGEVSKGVNRGLRHLGASGEQALGLGAEALGFDDAAKTLRGGAQGLREAAEAPRFAPEAESWDKVRGIGGALRWAGGHAGQMVPLIGGAAVGGILGGVPGAALAMAPDMVGQIDHGQQMNPEIAALPVGERVARNLPMAAAGTAAMMLPVGGMAARALGGGAAAKTLVGAVTRNVAEGAATGYAGMGAANLAVQQGVDPNAEFDMDQAHEAGVGGAVAMGLMHAPGAIPGYLKGQGQSLGEMGTQAKLWGSKKAEALRAGAQEKMDAAGPAGEAAGKKIGSFIDDSMDMLASAKDKVAGYAEKIKRGEPLGVDPAEFAAATGEKVNEMFGMADGQAKEWAKNTGEKILSKMGVDDARYNEIKEAVSNAGDRASQVIIAKTQSAMDLGAKAKDAVTKFYTENKAAYDEARANNPNKKSEDTDGVRTAIAEALQDSGILQRRKELTEHPGTLQELAGGLNMMLNQMTKGPVKPEVFARLNSILGDDAAPLINSLKRSLHDNLGPTELREYLGNLNGLMEAQKRGGTLNNQLRELLTPDAQDSMTGYDLTELGNHGLAFARGDHMNEVANADSIHKTQHDIAANNAVKALFAERFGPNADAAFKILEDHAGITKNRNSNEVRDNSKMSDLLHADLERKENEHGAVQETDHSDEGNRTVMKKVKRDRDNNILTEGPPDAMLFGNDKPDAKGNKKLKMNGSAMMHPDVFRANKEQGINHASEAMRRLSQEYPADKGYEVRWEPIDNGKDAMIELPDGADAKGNQKYRREHQYGHVVVENLGDPGRFSISDIEAMKHDTHAHSRSESRFAVGKHSFDAVKVAKVMSDRVGANTESTGTYPARVSDMFKRGIAELSDHFGVRIDVPDDVRVGGSGKDPMYWGDIKKLKYDTAEKGSPNRSPDEAHTELNDLREMYARATWNDARLAKAKLKPLRVTRDELDGLKERAKELSFDLENDLNKEYGPGNDIQERSMEAAPRKLQGDQVGPNRQTGDDRVHTESLSNRSYGEGISPRAIHERAQMEVADRAGKYVKPYGEVVDRTPGRWDKNGGLTKAGRSEILSGDHHGGIDIQNPNRGRSEMDDRMTNSRRFDALDFNDGQGRTDIGKDEQIHLQMAGLGDRDAPLFANGANGKKPLTDREIANDKRNTAPADNELVHRSNMDGSGHWLKRERYEKDFGHLIDTVDEWMRDSKTPAAKAITRKADVLVNNFAKMSEKDRAALIDAAGRPPSFGTDVRTDKIDYADVGYANHTLRQAVDGLSVKQAMRELDARDYKLSKLAKHPDNDHYASVLMEEMDLLRARLKDGSKDGVTGIGKPSLAAEVINRLYDKYVDQTPGVKAESVKTSKGTALDTNPVQFKKGKAIGGKDPAYGQAERESTAADLRQRGDDFAKALAEAEKREISGSGGKTQGGKLKGDIDEQAALQAEHEPLNQAVKAAGFGKEPAVEPRKMEGSPGPKAVAAKKAALLKAASSSDPALHEQLKASTDAKSLQRTVVELSAVKKPDAGTVKATEIANERLSELVRGSEDVGLNLQRKYSMESVRVHNDLGREGFAATHDSPIKHEGKFDWRAHQGKGEGNASFGAGTYLSTSEGVHKSYKGQFTAAVSLDAKERLKDDPIYAALRNELNALYKKGIVPADAVSTITSKMFAMEDALPKGPSPTYEVSVNIKPEQLLDWNKPLSEQSEAVRKALIGVAKWQIQKAWNGDTVHQLVIGNKLIGDIKDAKDTMSGKFEVDGRYDLRESLAEAKDAVMAKFMDRTTGNTIYEGLTNKLGSQAKASDYLQSLGILGHKYAASGGRNDAHPNYVIYDDSRITTNYVHFSKDASKPSGSTADAATQAAVEARLKEIAPKVSVAWKTLTDMDYAGDYNHQLKAIRLSIHALNPMGTGYHEALHHFLASMRDAGAHDVANVLEKAAASEHVIKQLNEIYKGNAEVLKQLADPEERAAYMFQHWALDKNFQVSMKANTVFGRIRDFISSLMGHWTNDERALHIMKYFQDGDWAKNSDKPSVVRRHLMETHKNDILAKAKSFVGPLGEMADAIVSAGSSRMRDSGIPALGEIADAVKLRGTDASGKDRGYVQAARIELSSQMRKFGEAMDPYKDPAHMADALEALQRNEKAKTPEGRLLAMVVKKQLREARDYMVKAGVNVGDLGKDYFPRVWDTHYISKNQQAFRDMLEPYIRSGKMKGTADELLKRLTVQGGSELGIESRETRQPGMQFTKERLLDFIDPRDAAEFLDKNLMGTMSSYMTQATRKAEWTRRLGGGKLEAMIERAEKQGASKEQLAMAETFLKGVDGTLGDGLNPTARRMMGNMVVYQNVRLLPMASFSMLIDPLGTMVRGGTAKDAWSTFKRGMVGITKTFDKEGGEVHDQQTKWAELVGVVDSAMMTHAMSDVFTQGMAGGTAKTINNTFFKYNLVEGLNRNFRIGATEAAMKFIQHHADGKASAHSGRWIKELGLEAKDIKTTAEGHLALTEADGLTAEQAGKIKAAVNQWVDGAILRPDAADKPMWMNDAHFALISHLKQFVYSFQHTILERTIHEMKHGNYTPMMSLASYVPVMMAADMAKGLLVNGGSQPDWQKGWTLADYVENGIERSGFYGAGQFGVDVIKDVHRGNTGAFALMGPTVEQLRDGVETLGGHKQFGNTVIDALPANALYKHTLGGEGKADPVFAE